MTAPPTTSDLIATIEGRLGVITLDRPKALNALSLAMVEALETVLDDWARNPAVDAVLIRSSSERAFCSGGDVRAIGILPDPAARTALGRSFFATEYRVNHRINTFNKPFIALLSGVAMGGGLGLSVHGSHRVASETLRMAMPETVLGLFPDVGGAWFLNRCPGAIGRYLALTGQHVGTADALTAGVATHHVPAARFAALIGALVAAPKLDRAAVDAIIAAHEADAGTGPLAERRAEIDRLFSGVDLDAVVAAVDQAASGADWIAEAKAVLHHASPTSLRATWRRMIDSRGQDTARVLKDDYRMAVRIVAGHDFPEGVRAIFVDKDRNPRWQPATLSEVTAAEIDALLAPLPGGELELSRALRSPGPSCAGGNSL
ncbi:enoyl-CoA hydratase/isomerase family protein [Dongia sp.]|uniref:enoyl-CoA hydratase/isomerase family protein n=1 Tax=Dongia sp. TaxID=1977262 RepID=UPI0037510AF1